MAGRTDEPRPAAAPDAGTPIDAAPGGGRPITPEAVRWAYRLFLDREAEDSGVAAEKARRLGDTRELRREFVDSEEFRRANPAFHVPTMTGHEPAPAIQDRCTEAEMDALHAHIQRAWEALGRREPYWSVCTSEIYRSASFPGAREMFEATGREGAARFFATLARNGVAPDSIRSILDYGCGVGRVLRWLAEGRDTAHGWDVSAPHLDLSRRMLEREGLRHVRLRQVERLRDLDGLPRVDAVHSIIVLQHNPPPIIAHVIARLLEALNPGGVAWFQVPTYRRGYAFSVSEYLAASRSGDASAGGESGGSGGAPRGGTDAAPAGSLEMEMHVLPQRRIFEIVEERQARVLEVIEDGAAGSAAGEVSNTFLVRKEGGRSG